jgi:hypothetical protein
LDELVATKWRKLGIDPAPLSSEEVFLRRVYLDLIGTLPTADEARRYLAKRDPRKRSRLIDELLHREEYDMYWATRFSDWTGNDNRFTPQPRAKTAWLWHDWLRDKLRRNVAYDEIATGIVTATTREGRSIDEVADEYKTVRDNLDEGHGSRVYDRRRTNDIFWQKAGNNRPQTVGLQLAYAFLGVRLECAQCHKHPFDRWTQDDFGRFTSFFSLVSQGVPDDVPKALTKVKNRQQYRYREIFTQTKGKKVARLKKMIHELLWPSGCDLRRIRTLLAR